MGLRLVTPPTTEPVTLADVKAALRVDFTDDDALIAGFLSSAREWVERSIQSKLALQTWELVSDGFPTAEIILPFGPVQSITSIKYNDEGDVEQTLASDSYSLDNVNVYPSVIPADQWPSTIDTFDAVRVRFVVGYSDGTLVPSPIRSAIILKVKELYDGEDSGDVVHNLLVNYYQMVA